MNITTRKKKLEELGQLVLDLTSAPVPVTKMTDPDKGAKRYCIHHDESKRYTTICADNIHHAGNKATLLWKDGWTGISVSRPYGYLFTGIKDFNKIIRGRN